MKRNSLIYGVTSVVFIYALYSMYRIMTSIAPDFSVFYDAAKGLRAYANIYTLPMYTGLGYPPFTLLPFLSFTWLPYQVAQGTWVVLSFVFLLVCIRLSLLLVYKKATFVAECTGFIFTWLAFPTKFTFGMGQVNIVALALFLGTLLLARGGRRVWAGFMLGALFIMKPHFLLFAPVFLIIGMWQELGVAFVLLILTAAATGFAFGWAQYTYYVNVTLPPLLAYAGRGIYYNQSLGSLLARMAPTVLARDLTIWVSTLIVIIALWWIWQKKLSMATATIFFIPVFLLVEPLSWQHHYVFLLPVFVWLFSKLKRMNMPAIILALSYVLVAFNIRDPASVHGAGAALILSHVAIGNLLVLGHVLYATS